MANCDISPNFIRQHKYYRLPVYGLIHVPLHLRILNYTRQEKIMSTSILKYFKLVKPAADHLPDPEGTLSSKLPSSAIASANSEVRSVMATAIHHFPTRAASCDFSAQKLLSIARGELNSPNFLPPN